MRFFVKFLLQVSMIILDISKKKKHHKIYILRCFSLFIFGIVELQILEKGNLFSAESLIF